MSIYSRTLDAYLERAAQDGVTQSDFAAKADCTQAAISRYAKGVRFPTREIAESIEKASKGAVPLVLWREVAAQRAGLAA